MWLLQAEAVIGARMSAGRREYLIVWKDEIDEGEPWETWETYDRLMVPSEENPDELEIHATFEREVAHLDQLAPAEELALVALDQQMIELERCVLSAGERVLHDHGEHGFTAGRVCLV